MSDQSIYVTKRHTIDLVSENLIYVLQEKFNFDYQVNSAFIEIQTVFGQADLGGPILIEDLITLLKNLKEMGSTHVEIDYHIDHGEYLLSGYIIEESSEEEIAKWKVNKTQMDLRNLRIRELQEEINELRRI